MYFMIIIELPGGGHTDITLTLLSLVAELVPGANVRVMFIEWGVLTVRKVAENAFVSYAQPVCQRFQRASNSIICARIAQVMVPSYDLAADGLVTS